MTDIHPFFLCLQKQEVLESIPVLNGARQEYTHTHTHCECSINLMYMFLDCANSHHVSFTDVYFLQWNGHIFDPPWSNLNVYLISK